MKGNYKNQRRKIILKISAIMLSVWLVVSVLFSAITLSMEKQTQITKANDEYTTMRNAIVNEYRPSYNLVCNWIDIVKSHWLEIGMRYVEFIPEYGANMTYDNNIHIIVYESPEELDDYIEIMNTDKEIYFSFEGDCPAYHYTGTGILNYDEFASSITESELKTIKEYLNIEKDKNGYMHLLSCKSIYYNAENGHMYPKTVEIVKAKEGSEGYIVDKTLETFELNVKHTDGCLLYEAREEFPSIISTQFVYNNFSSNNLLNIPSDNCTDTTCFDVRYDYDGDIEHIVKSGLFTYHLFKRETFGIQSTGFEESKEDVETQKAIMEYSDSSEIYDIYPEKENLILYARQIDLLECCGDTLIIGVSSLFIFFLIITLILILMMCKMIKTQLVEEQKRSELTNALAHDIKTPLFVISGYTQNLKENVNSEKRVHYCDKIIDKTQEVNSLVHKMLELSRPDDYNKTLTPEDIDINKTVEDIISTFETIPDNKHFKLNKIEICNINADKELINRALLNLISNAITYSNPDSEITIDISKNAFSISNKCTSISKSDIKHLTEPYYRIDKSRNTKGNGLGLSIVKSIADIHGYKLNIELSSDIIKFTLGFHK